MMSSLKTVVFNILRKIAQRETPLNIFEKTVLFVLAKALLAFCVDGKRRMLYLRFLQERGVGVVPQRYFEPLPLVTDVERITRSPRLIAKDPGESEDMRAILALRNNPESLKQFDAWLSELNKNPMFRGLDALAYHTLIKKYKPKRIIEIGSGFSALLALKTLKENQIEGKVTSIEPFPRDFLAPLHKTYPNHTLIKQKIQDVPLSDGDMFEQLEANDFLFIDSTHVSTVGGDLTTIFCEIFPKLKPGVIVHVHDVSWPYEYPRRLVYDYGRFYNELYLIAAILGQGAYTYLFGTYHTELLHPAAPPEGTSIDYYRGMSLWIQKK